jgi:putative Holliday junction resolvase
LTIIKLYNDNNQANNSFLIDKNLLEQVKSLSALQPVIALDIGLKRIGVATCDPHHIAITPTAIIKRENFTKDCGKIIAIMLDKKINLAVLGIPPTIKNNIGESNIGKNNIATHIEEFSQFLDDKLLQHNDLANLILINEHLSSFEARRINRENFYLHRQKKYQKQHKFYDDIASAVILQYFFEILGE